MFIISLILPQLGMSIHERKAEPTPRRIKNSVTLFNAKCNSQKASYQKQKEAETNSNNTKGNSLPPKKVCEDAQQRGAEDGAKHSADNASRVTPATSSRFRGSTRILALKIGEQTSLAVTLRLVLAALGGVEAGSVHHILRVPRK